MHPLIGITCAGRNKRPKYPELYINAVEKAGGRAEYVTPEDPHPERFDGYIIPGGLDIAPSFFNEEKSCIINPEDPARIYFEISLIREIIEARKPLLGICYGMQLINVCLGGSLYQDINQQLPGSLRHADGMHSVSISDNPYTASGTYEVNSSHHQAVRNPGRKLRAFACSSDTIVEAFYGECDNFMLGVQWHPERTDDYLSGGLFGALVDACRGR